MKKQDNDNQQSTEISPKGSSGINADMAVAANCDQFTPIPIENLILTIKGQQVMVDRDLAEVSQVDTKALNLR